MMKASLGVALALAIPMMALSTVPDATTNSTRPPTNLKKVGDHWTPWDPPVSPDGARVYLIEKGDTLWDLAQQDLHLQDCLTEQAIGFSHQRVGLIS